MAFDYDNYISPCKDICIMDVDDHYCVGCYRTKSEIKKWYKFSKEEKLAIMEQLDSREQNGFNRK